jgi:hypothetical protein
MERRRSQEEEMERRRSQEEEVLRERRRSQAEEMGRERRRSQEEDEVEERVIRESSEAEERKREREKEEDDLEAYQIQLVLEMSARDNPEEMEIEVAKQLSLGFCPPQTSPAEVLAARYWVSFPIQYPARSISSSSSSIPIAILICDREVDCITCDCLRLQYRLLGCTTSCLHYGVLVCNLVYKNRMLFSHELRQNFSSMDYHLCFMEFSLYRSPLFIVHFHSEFQHMLKTPQDHGHCLRSLFSLLPVTKCILYWIDDNKNSFFGARSLF